MEEVASNMIISVMMVYLARHEVEYSWNGGAKTSRVVGSAAGKNSRFFGTFFEFWSDCRKKRRDQISSYSGRYHIIIGGPRTLHCSNLT